MECPCAMRQVEAFRGEARQRFKTGPGLGLAPALILKAVFFLQNSQRPTRAEIDLRNLSQNLKAFRQHLNRGTRIMAVVKANAYGHGAVEVSRRALEAGAEWLGVAFWSEGRDLREAGIRSPILVFGSPFAQEVPYFFDYALTPSVYTLETARDLSREARRRGEAISLHVKVDTGMGRVGIYPPGETASFLVEIKNLPGLKVEGLYTHFAAADEKDQAYTGKQSAAFRAIVSTLEERGLCPPLRHAANSAAALMHPDTWLDMVRLGISIYGHYPSREVTRTVALKPLLTLKSTVAFVKEVPPGTPVSYGCTYRTPEKARIASIPLGYADGYSRLLSNRARVLIRGQQAPLVGRICMDQCMVRVDHIPGVSKGDEVVLYGRQGGEEIPVEEAADLQGTINYEVLCAISTRVPRFYIDEGLVESKGVSHTK